MDPVCPLDYRYGRKELKDIFGETRRLQYLLDAEAALARAHANVGNIPKNAAIEITKKASTKYVKVDRVNKIESETKHDIMAVTRALAEQCSGDAGKYIHLGATSYDIVDTANALQFAESTDYIRKELKNLRKTLVSLAKKHKKTVMVGRTHGQHTIPITFGLKMAGYAMEVDRHMERLFECKSRLLIGKLSGAVGTGAALGPKALKIQEEMLKELKLGVEDIATQIVCRDRYNELLGVLCNIATSMEKFATEIRNLQRDEIGEVAEAFEAKKQVGSSTMPHKRNPITCEQICGLSRVVRGFIIPTYENAIQWHERDLCNSSSERFILPHSIILTDWVIFKTNDVFKNIKVFPDRMKKNMEISKGLPMAESLMTTLIGKGMGRGDAHELMRKTALKAAAENKTLKEVFVQENKKLKLLTDKEIDSALKPENYLGATEKLIDKVTKKLER
ncbi:MAG: adenylosuccinate lyase [Thermoplasmatales archaeon]|nr:adenylosuccinate lyase [Thermoplasmatales archaeon]MCK4996283.1 adenylosuccinate lyase [Thermoplasmatales archaeon]MCK5636161.1 adenylosuccinate lyase [Thermoplasmatales archaeon]